MPALPERRTKRRALTEPPRPGRVHSLLLVLACLCQPAATARAFSVPEVFFAPAASGGGGGRWFTGSPADGYGCGECHSSTPADREFPLYVTGLPQSGFSPGEVREIVLSWPEFADYRALLRGDPMLPLPADAPLPTAGLVAELVAETGKGSGTIEIRTATAGPFELCEMTRPNLKPRLGATLYQVRPGVAPIAIEPDENGVLRCEARQLGQRCIVAMDSCGTRELRMVWIAPPQSEGTIWFSAGFVGSETLGGTPDNDSVVEVTYPMEEDGTPSAVYEEAFEGACSVARPGADGGPPTVWALALLLLALRRARPRARRIALAAIVLGAVAGCASDERTARDNAIAGLYTPGSALGASDPTDVLRPGMGLGERCVAPSTALIGELADASVALGGELSVEYETQTLGGRYAPKNCTAVWVETMDGEFVATLEITAAVRRRGLRYFSQRTCTQEPGPDVTTSATLRDHEDLHVASWSGVDYQGNPMPDGRYQLSVEVTEDDKAPGLLETFEFDKGPSFSQEMPVAVDGYLRRLALAWTPEGAGGQ